jgi:uncharacterized protein (DUF1015 family)
MAQFYPFSALRPKPEHVNTVSCPPYDVLTLEQAKSLSEGKSDSLLHVILPEINGQAPLDELAKRGAQALRDLASRPEVMISDDHPYFYIYEQVLGIHSRIGIFGTVLTDDYQSGKIIRHELTRPDKVEERMQHILTQHAHAEPVMLTYRNTPALKACIRAALIDAIPLYDFTDEQEKALRAQFTKQNSGLTDEQVLALGSAASTIKDKDSGGYFLDPSKIPGSAEEKADVILRYNDLTAVAEDDTEDKEGLWSKIFGWFGN